MNKAYAAARNYTGPVKGVILDWSGTTADKYVLAPAVVFVEVFNKHKVMKNNCAYENQSRSCCQ